MLSRLPTRCPNCRARFTKEERAEHRRIHTECVDEWYAKLQEEKKRKAERERKAKQKVERVADRVKREGLKTLTQWEQDCRKIVQAIARVRDRDDGCISCHMSANYGGAWHGSHFRSVGAASAVQFNLWNIHKSCAQCNLFKSGNIAAYEPRLIEKIGQDKVDWLKSQNQIVRYRVDYLKRFKSVMGKKLRRLEKRTA